LVPEEVMVSCGANERLNTVPLPELPPPVAVPYRVLSAKIKPAYGLAPSLLVTVEEEPEPAVNAAQFRQRVRLRRAVAPGG